jgi:hypothetical protein
MGDAALVWHGNFAVEHDFAPERQQVAERRAEQRRPIVPVPGDQLQPTAPIQDGDDPVAVVFDLVQPIAALRRPGG